MCSLVYINANVSSDDVGVSSSHSTESGDGDNSIRKPNVSLDDSDVSSDDDELSHAGSKLYGARKAHR